MKPISKVEGRAYPWGAKNVDTDVIISAQWLKTISRRGLGKGAFESLRAQPGNIFDDPRYAGAPILIAGDNFGCGSSREHAAWALADMGIEAVLAPSFSDIFSGNAFKNGILTVTLPQPAIDRLIEVTKNHEIIVDLETMTVTSNLGDVFPFAIDAFRRQCLLQGLDEIGLTLSMESAIDDHEHMTAQDRPWLSAA
ncbi:MULTISPECIES: 3-isopropylmalate dehydratase small subunit [Sphingobium]|uniref:3-isopropylmalate dehydratase small subunit n=1 Tax=Sphingobium chungbukense TaxID=56193 RepID=A0A0M3AN74_9SPHN|nr:MULTISPECIES: 3-isopropylmalate dehydratase small subunit [Sphingobium]KKW91285.1 3-isopropylmalate dehydratase [Sphingobium chungbukense]PJG47592.1 3-isopropylmalate dehydratase small subunit [Sphingobium sp. LB126]